MTRGTRLFILTKHAAVVHKGQNDIEPMRCRFIPLRRIHRFPLGR